MMVQKESKAAIRDSLPLLLRIKHVAVAETPGRQLRPVVSFATVEEPAQCLP